MFIIYSSKKVNLKDHFVKDNSAFKYYRNIQTLAIDRYKFVNGISPDIINKIFQLREDYHNNLGHPLQFFVAPIHIVGEKSPNTELFWSGYSKIRTRKSSIFGHFSRSDSVYHGTESLLYLGRKIC